MRLLILMLLIFSMSNIFGQRNSYNYGDYIPQYPVNTIGQALMYKQALYDRNKASIQKKVNILVYFIPIKKISLRKKYGT
jgi:hypothetical protein